MRRSPTRLTVPVTDDPSLPVWTFRMWTMGFLSFALLSFLNQFFAYRSEPIVISQISIQVVALPIGHFLAWVLLEKKFSVFGRECSLNPGPFNVKEHVLISIFANAGASFGGGNAYAIGIVIIIKAFYKRNISFVTSLLLVITTQLGSPLVTPFFATANILVGYVLLVYIMLPVAYWVLNLYSASRYPPFSNELFDASGQLYNIHNIVNDKFEIDMDAYAKQGRIHLSLFFAVSYGLGFATIATTLSHVTFFYGKFRESYKGKMDVHARLMKRYDDIPNWWFYILLEASMTVSMVLCTVFKEEVQLPWWASSWPPRGLRHGFHLHAPHQCHHRNHKHDAGVEYHHGVLLGSDHAGEADRQRVLQGVRLHEHEPGRLLP
uniref:Oligopeptide transporter n=1 Tax=Hordeum vulgare subsp. vulgare TaxID=112509 RepID=A0A8I7B2H7_HORVV